MKQRLKMYNVRIQELHQAAKSYFELYTARTEFTQLRAVTSPSAIHRLHWLTDFLNF